MSTPAPVLRGAVAIWLVALAVYLLAVFHRSSLAVAGLAAADRFDINAAQLSTFVMLQLAVYAAMQIPVGLLLDRFGPRRILTIGCLVLAVSQAGFAVADTYGAALTARVFVGLGDAMTFVCVLRLVNTWFAPRAVALITQLTGLAGQLGAIVAAAPMTWALSRLGWTTTYLAAAGLGLALLVLLVLVVRDAPGQRRQVGPAMSRAVVRSSLVSAWRHPGTRLGFWTHFTAQFSATTLSLLWGYPYFVRGEGRSPAEAGILLTVLVATVMVAGPLMALAITRHPWHRSDLVLGIVTSVMTVWAVVLLWPGPVPFGALLVLVVVVGVGGPASMIGFDFGRSFNPAQRLGTATGIINQGGFIASLLVITAIGIVLDWRMSADGPQSPREAFRWAMSVQYAVWVVGMFQIWRLRRRTRALLVAEEPDARRLMRRLG